VTHHMFQLGSRRLVKSCAAFASWIIQFQTRRMPSPLKLLFLRSKLIGDQVSCTLIQDVLFLYPLYTYQMIIIIPIPADIYVSMVSNTHQVASKGWFVGMVSTTVETSNPEQEVQPGLALLGPIKQKWVSLFNEPRSWWI